MGVCRQSDCLSEPMVDCAVLILGSSTTRGRNPSSLWGIHGREDGT